MNKFSVPADFNVETLNAYNRLNEQYDDYIHETYGQLNFEKNILGSGRSADKLPYVNKKQLEKYISYSESKNIDFNYVLNTTCLSNQDFTRDGIKNIIKFLKYLHDVGVKSITVCLPSLIELIRESGLPFKIKASTVCSITNSDKARSYLSMNVDRIVVDESINRNFCELKNILHVTSKVEMIVNVVCYKNCIYRPFHHNQMSHDYECNKSSANFYSHRCIMKRIEKPENILKMPFIRPEDLHYYEEIGIHYYKIQGRQAVAKGDIVKTVISYLNKSYEGDLLDLLDCFSPTNSFRVKIDNRKLDRFIEPFLDNNFCNDNCETCLYCNKYFNDNLSFDESMKVNKLAMKYYQSTDDYKQMIKSIMESTYDKK